MESLKIEIIQKDLQRLLRFATMMLEYKGGTLKKKIKIRRDFFNEY